MELTMLGVAFVFFATVMFMLHSVKPPFVYHPDGSLRDFGIGYKQKTVVPLWLCTLVVAILSYGAAHYFVP